VEASPTGAGLVTDTLPAGKSPRGPGLASLPGWDDRIPRNAKIRVALSAFAPLPRLRPFPPSSPLFQCRKGAGFCQRPESGRQSARGGQLASHQLLQYSELHGWGWRRNGSASAHREARRRGAWLDWRSFEEASGQPWPWLWIPPDDGLGHVGFTFGASERKTGTKASFSPGGGEGRKREQSQGILISSSYPSARSRSTPLRRVRALVW
jgi:hypothetical protein